MLIYKSNKINFKKNCILRLMNKKSFIRSGRMDELGQTDIRTDGH